MKKQVIYTHNFIGKPPVFTSVSSHCVNNVFPIIYRVITCICSGFQRIYRKNIFHISKANSFNFLTQKYFCNLSPTLFAMPP